MSTPSSDLAEEIFAVLHKAKISDAREALLIVVAQIRAQANAAIINKDFDVDAALAEAGIKKDRQR